MSTESMNSNVVGIDKKIPFFEKLVFGSANGISTFYFMMISTWLLFFYTDVLKISPAYVGVMFVAVRILDACITPVFGVFLDRQNTRWGRYKPWFFIIWLGMAVGGFLAFFPTDFGHLGNMIFATVTYIVFSIFMSVATAPAVGLTSTMTKRQDDRMTISIASYIWIMVFAIVVQIGSLPLIQLLGNGNQADGFRSFMLIAMIFNIIFTMIIFSKVKERFTLKVESEVKFNFKLVVETLVKNKYAVISLVFVLALNLFNAIRSAVGIYYYKYFFEDANMMVVVGALTMLPTIIGVFLSPVITKKIGLKNNILMMVFITIVTSVAMFFLPANDSGKIAFYALFAIGGLFMGIATPAQGTMLPAAVDYGEWKLNTNSGGFLGSLSGFMQTLSTAISGGVTALILAYVKYVPDVPQTAASLNGIKFMMGLLPAIVFILGLVMFAWDMTEQKHKQIVEEINLRRNQSNESDQAVEDHMGPNNFSS
ncbi:glycoside-pentoside-hexuronide (GPH):cation symporter [Paenibacillus sp. FSL R10-2734]|uniref:MFS transporter n=1 Tax=Paenibacillus sp. FSL R10-2734 TaxID=2954691 RepID=UPI0030D8B672